MTIIEESFFVIRWPLWKVNKFKVKKKNKSKKKKKQIWKFHEQSDQSSYGSIE